MSKIFGQVSRMVFSHLSISPYILVAFKLFYKVRGTSRAFTLETQLLTISGWNEGVRGLSMENKGAV